MTLDRRWCNTVYVPPLGLTRMLRAVVVLTSLLLAAAPTLAGTREDPELRDAEGDVDYAGLVPLPAGPVADTLDLQAVWIDGETEDSLSVNFLVKDTAAFAAMAQDPQMDIRIGMFFHLGTAPDETWFVARYVWAGSNDRSFLWHYDADGKNLGETAVESTLQDNVFSFRMARQDLGSPAAGTTLLVEEGRATANPTASAGLYHFGDYALANGEGYMFTMGPTASNVSAPPPTPEATDDAPTDVDDGEAPPAADGKETPGLAMMTILAGLALATAMRRRGQS